MGLPPLITVATESYRVRQVQNTVWKVAAEV